MKNCPQFCFRYVQNFTTNVIHLKAVNLMLTKSKFCQNQNTKYVLSALFSVRAHFMLSIWQELHFNLKHFIFLKNNRFLLNLFVNHRRGR